MGKSSRGSRCCHRGPTGGEGERDRDMADVSLSLSLKALLYFFASGEKKTEVLPAFFDRITIFKAHNTQGWSKSPRISSKIGFVCPIRHLVTAPYFKGKP